MPPIQRVDQSPEQLVHHKELSLALEFAASKSLLHPDQRQLREYEVSLAHSAHVDPRVRRAVERTEQSTNGQGSQDPRLDHYQRSLDVGMLWVANVLPEVWQLPYSTLAWRQV